jgi:hypothetical protein
MLSYCGVDVSKDRLGIAVLSEGQSWSVTNDATGWTTVTKCSRDFSVVAVGLGGEFGRASIAGPRCFGRTGATS